MFHSALQSILTIVLPKPSFRVTPSQPDPIYYTATVFRAYNHPKSSFSNFNVSMTKVDGTPRLGSRPIRGLTSTNSICSIRSRSDRVSTCCCSCSCPYDLSSCSPNAQSTGHELLTAIATSFLESPLPCSSSSTFKTARHTDSWNSSLFSRIPKLSDMPFASQDFQKPLPPNEKRLRRTQKRITSSSSANGLDHTAAPGSFYTANEFQSGVESLQNLDTAKRTSTHELDLSVSDSCSSFDASDHDGTYSSIPMHLSSPVSLSSRPQNRISQAHSDMFPPAFELSPIMENSCTFEEMDDILALYSDSPILGRMNESHASSEFAFDDADWEPEPIFDTADECESQIDTADAESVVTDPKRVRPRQLSYALKAVDSEDVFLSAGTHGHTQSDTHADLLSPPSLTLTFPTPVMEDASTFPEPIPLANASDQSLTFPSIPRTPPRRSQSHNVLLEPPTPMPPLPRCTSCGFGFSFDVTGSTDMIHRPVNPCDQCQAQWDRCRKWYGKRGWQVERTEDTSSQDTEIKKEKPLKRVSRRFSQIVEGVFTTDRKSQRSSIDPSARGATSKRSSKRLSWRYQKQRTDFDKTQDDLSRIQNGGHGSSRLNENGTRVRDYALFPNVGLEPTDLQPSPSNTGGASNSTKSNLPRPLSFFGTQVTNSDELPKKRRRSFSVFGLSRTLSLRRHQVI
ncbi:hypothetical protein EV361DRAFT_1029586 [Lentinula raphanica]|nr:hypothetical protein EV361DRAFT_1029586 [Lentinula raphanica]